MMMLVVDVGCAKVVLYVGGMLDYKDQYDIAKDGAQVSYCWGARHTLSIERLIPKIGCLVSGWMSVLLNGLV